MDKYLAALLTLVPAGADQPVFAEAEGEGADGARVDWASVAIITSRLVAEASEQPDDATMLVGHDHAS